MHVLLVWTAYATFQFKFKFNCRYTKSSLRELRTLYLISEIPRGGKSSTSELKVRALSEEFSNGQRCAPRGAFCVSFVSISGNLKTTTGVSSGNFIQEESIPQVSQKERAGKRGERERATFLGHYNRSVRLRIFSSLLSPACHGTAFSHGHPIWSPTRTRTTVINRKAPSEPRLSRVSNVTHDSTGSGRGSAK